MAFLFNPLMTALRPALLPIVAGSLGLFYGSYDITKMILGPLLGSKDDVSFHHRVVSFGSGFGVSVAGVWVRCKVDPPPQIPTLDPKLVLNSNVAKRWFLQSMHTVKFFPYFWYGTSIALSGVITGAAVSLTR
jgi:hypothetical protein